MIYEVYGRYVEGLERDRLPNLGAISARLEPRTGWNATPVSGFLPAAAFPYAPD